jgi:hypothetical protein
LQELRLGTKWYQSVTFGTSMQYYSPYGLSIGHRRTTPRGETMPEELSDQKEVAPVAGNAISTNLGDVIDRRVKEAHQHEY